MVFGLFGGGGPDTVETSSDIPARYRDFADQNLAIAGTIANRPYVPYQGQRVAGFTPDQFGAFNFVRGLGGAYQPMMDQANQAYTAGFNSAVDPSIMMQRYQDPYTEQVIDATEADLNRTFDRASEQARLSSPFGGARLGVREGVIEGERGRALADVGSRLRSDAFRTAAGLGQQATGQLYAGGDRFAGLGQNIVGTGLQYGNALAGVGQQQQGLNQANMNLRYGDFLDELNYPLTALSIRQSALGQTPMGSVGRQPVTGGGGFGSTLSGVGGLLSGLGAVGAFCWVAREVYGDERWLKVRDWMLTKAPDELRDKYARIGPKVAEKIRHDLKRKAEYRAVFDSILEAA